MRVPAAGMSAPGGGDERAGSAPPGTTAGNRLVGGCGTSPSVRRALEEVSVRRVSSSRMGRPSSAESGLWLFASRVARALGRVGPPRDADERGAVGCACQAPECSLPCRRSRMPAPPPLCASGRLRPWYSTSAPANLCQRTKEVPPGARGDRYQPAQTPPHTHVLFYTILSRHHS